VVTSIWKLKFASGAAHHYNYGALQPNKRRSEILHLKDYKWEENGCL